MRQLDPSKLHVRFQPGLTADRFALPRRYTLTHSDRTGDLFLTIADDYGRDQISGWYTRLMRDEILAEWVVTPDGPALDIHCHVSGGVVLGSAAWRDSILRTHMPQVIQAVRQGDAALFAAQARLDHAPVRVHFHSHLAALDRIEPWGVLADYAPQERGVSRRRTWERDLDLPPSTGARVTPLPDPPQRVNDSPTAGEQRARRAPG